jgi:hypothetical protein
VVNLVAGESSLHLQTSDQQSCIDTRNIDEKFLATLLCKNILLKSPEFRSALAEANQSLKNAGLAPMVRLGEGSRNYNIYGELE